MINELLEAPAVTWVTWVRVGVLLLFLLITAIIDIYTEKAPNWITLPTTGFGLLFGIVAGCVYDGSDLGYLLAGLKGFGLASAGFALGFIPLFLVFMVRGIRGGDVKTMGAVGAVSANLAAVIHTLFWGIMVAALLALLVMLRKRVVKQTMSRIFRAMLLYSSGSRPDFENEESARVPYAVGFLFGAVLGAVPLLLHMYQLPWIQQP